MTITIIITIVKKKSSYLIVTPELALVVFDVAGLRAWWWGELTTSTVGEAQVPAVSSLDELAREKLKVDGQVVGCPLDCVGIPSIPACHAAKKKSCKQNDLEHSLNNPKQISLT